jgi:hypothetical protein
MEEDSPGRGQRGMGKGADADNLKSSWQRGIRKRRKRKRSRWEKKLATVTKTLEMVNVKDHPGHEASVEEDEHEEGLEAIGSGVLADDFRHSYDVSSQQDRYV